MRWGTNNEQKGGLCRLSIKQLWELTRSLRRPVLTPRASWRARLPTNNESWPESSPPWFLVWMRLVQAQVSMHMPNRTTTFSDVDTLRRKSAFRFDDTHCSSPKWSPSEDHSSLIFFRILLHYKTREKSRKSNCRWSRQFSWMNGDIGNKSIELKTRKTSTNISDLTGKEEGVLLRVSCGDSRVRSDCSYVWIRLRRQLPGDYCNCERTALLYFRGHWYSTRNTPL